MFLDACNCPSYGGCIHFGEWQTVYGWSRELARRFPFQTIHDVDLMLDRERQSREQSPSTAVIDCQSAKPPAVEERGFDAAMTIVGRERQIAVDTMGRLLMEKPDFRRQCRRPGDPR